MDAEEESQRYKVGKFILETKKTCAGVSWDHGSEARNATPPVKLGAGDNIDFDSQDEDECEDLFAGVWSPSLALKRRRAKRFGREGTR